ncbi:MAG: aminopeptidase [Rhizobiales bacterium]|uniref:DmpA family aminopeptidase n=1 Tax=unclassified Leeuwenhoekiella TaxID=2615029 RepID=UPI000C654674|nr:MULTISPECIES: P1 family peptidase [unclassified Leeuwenhoekiella]MAW96874.1 aminopeptidase [Leeuwenhoekiella sp.]MBA67587.1 aminopeptidase [Hyphomicrobiales bacterium]|tara:strand:- start:6419 stop:7594 length:1176 start_codon:yes stop_codon:yes gene_type:complete
MHRICFFLSGLLLCSLAYAQKPRARDLGVPFVGEPGAFNAITDVAGVEVGYSTIISGEGDNLVGKGPVRTGVTAIFPRGKAKKFSPVYANWYSLNGNGEMTGTTWVTESGFLETPVMITNTNSVGEVRQAVLKWYVDTDWYRGEDWWYTYPVVAETYDGFLNDIYGFHVKEKHVLEAIADSKGGPIAEGNVGGGTGMMCLGFKGGTGTASRVFTINDSTYTVGALVQSNFGAKRNLTIAGVPVGVELKDTLNYTFNAPPQSRRQEGDGSIIVIVATDVPLLPHQLKRIAQRIPLGVGIVGGRGSNGSGDIFLAFSTANENAFNRDETTTVKSMANDQLMPVFEATVQAVEEAIINAMVAAETMTGINGNTAYALPHDLLIKTLKKYNRIEE